MSLKQICEEFLYGQKCRKEASQIKREKIAQKFERSPITITKVIRGKQPKSMSDWEFNMIRALEAERIRLLDEASARSMHALAARYETPKYQIETHLQFVCWREIE